MRPGRGPRRAGVGKLRRMARRRQKTQTRLARGACCVLAFLVAALLAPVAVADTVELVGGDVLHGKVVEQTDDLVVIEHDTLGHLELPADQVASVTIAAEEAAQDTAQDVVQPLEEAQAEAPDAKEQKEKSPWTLAIDLSLNISQGNTDESDFRFGLNARREMEDTRWRIDSSWYYKKSDGSSTDNKFTLGSRYDWLMPGSKWFWFVAGRLDWDKFESWDQRISGQTGPGYHLIENDKFKLDVLGGLGTRKEWGSDNDSWKFEGSVGLDFEYTITERQSLDFDITYFSVLDDLDDYRTRSTGNWRYALSDDLHLSLLVGYSWEYQNFVDPGDEYYDFRFFVGVQYAF
jgi:putative salt-induced outer membrane protein YdiY